MLCDPVTDDVLELPQEHFIKGGTYCLGGTRELWLNVTYNYAPIFYLEKCLGDEGIRTIYGKTGAESIPVLQKAISSLSNDVNPDYWHCSEGNAKKALCSLLSFAQMRPDGVWRGD